MWLIKLCRRRFFQPGPTADPLYALIRDAPPNGDYLDRARELIERIWQTTSEFIDIDAPAKARSDLMPVFWEMYLANSLFLNGIILASRANRRLINNRGPDLATLIPAISIEAVMPTNGSGSDGITRFPIGTAYEVPQDKMILRIRSVIEDKASKFRSYIDATVISSREPTVIAISGAKLEFRQSEAVTPYVVRAALAIGHFALHIDKKDGIVVGRSLEFQDVILKNNNAPVKTDLFLGERLSHVSALLYSPLDCFCEPWAKGEEFIIVRNSFAANPLPIKWPGVGLEYQIEDGSLRSERNGSLNSPRAHALAPTTS